MCIRILFIALLILSDANAAFGVDLTQVASLGAETQDAPQANEMYRFLHGLKPDSPFKTPYILLSASIPKVTLEKFGFPEVDFESRSKKVVFLIDRNGSVVWLHALATPARFVTAKPLEDGTIGILASDKSSTFLRVDRNGNVLWSGESDLTYPMSKWGRDFTEFNGLIVFPGQVIQFYRESLKFWQSPKSISNGRLFSLGENRNVAAREIWNPNLDFAPDYQKVQKKYNEIIGIEANETGLSVLISGSNKIVNIDPMTGLSSQILMLLDLEQNETVVHASRNKDSLVILASSGRVIMWGVSSTNRLTQRWIYIIPGVRSQLKRGSVALTENETVIVLATRRNLERPKKGDLLFELESTSGSLGASLKIPSIANPGGYRAVPMYKF